MGGYKYTGIGGSGIGGAGGDYSHGNNN